MSLEAKSGETKGPCPGSCRILLIEDNADGRQRLRDLLALWGHQVEMAADGVQGLEKVRTWRPDVALIDIGLPGLDGYQVAQQVRAVPAVTGACLLIRKELFHALGGFDERYPVTHGDVDLCCRVRASGLLVVVTPHARLLHFESLSRGYTQDCPGQGHLAALARLPVEPQSD